MRTRGNPGRDRVRAWVTGLLVAVLLGGAAVTAGPATAAATPRPTVVLVHGSFADASSWSSVIRGLQKRGFPVIAAANPLRGVSTVKPSVFRRIFAADLPSSRTRIVAAAQRPTALSTLTDPSGPPAWTTIPSWYLVAGADKAVGAANERFMAQRIQATTVEAKGASHVEMICRPAKVVKLIVDAAAGRR